MKKYDYLIVGAGLFGAVFAHEATRRGKTCLVIDKRGHIGGNIYTEEVEGIQVHRYGAHIFHTSRKQVWDYINQFAEFNHFVNSPIAVYKDELYNLPFNMNTFHQLWGVRTPAEAKAKIQEQIARMHITHPKNLEEQALALVGQDVYEKLVEGYTRKQWGRECKDLPAFIIKRLPLRYTYDNNYFKDPYQGIPKGGYTRIVKKLLEGVQVCLNTDFFANREELTAQADKVLFTGMIDEFYDYCYGELEYRSLRFETEVLDMGNYQGNAVVNYTDYEVPYTRIIEHKHFEFGTQPKTVITREYPAAWEKGKEPYYPVNDPKNSELFDKYERRALEEKNVIFGGRLGMYRYMDMDQVIEEALSLAETELTVEDLVGTVEVVVFPRDYEKSQQFLNEEGRVFIQGRVSAEDDRASKLILEKIRPFDNMPREIWIQFDNKESYTQQSQELLADLRRSPGDSAVVIYLKDVKAIKKLPVGYHAQIQDSWLNYMYEKYGKTNVKVVERGLKNL